MSHSPASAADEVDVSITDSAYDPSPVTIQADDDIFWCNDGTKQHTATSDSPGIFDTEAIDPGEDSDCIGIETPSVGTYPYHSTSSGDDIHGVLIVEAAPTTTTAATVATTTTSAPTTTTTRRTTTTARRVTTTRATTSTSTSSTIASTTSSLDTTTSSELATSTTFGQFAIETADKDNDGFKIAVIISAAVALAGIGYLVYRWRFARSRY